MKAVRSMKNIKIRDVIKFKSNASWGSKIYLKEVVTVCLSIRDYSYKVDITGESPTNATYNVYIKEIIDVYTKEKNPEYFL